jgi:AraC-like DNA-binding protein
MLLDELITASERWVLEDPKLDAPKDLKEAFYDWLEVGLEKEGKIIRAAWMLRPGDLCGVNFHSLTNPVTRIVLHSHDYFELAYVYRGVAYHSWESGEQVLRAGDALLLNPYVRHAVRIEEGSVVVNLVILPEAWQRGIAGPSRSMMPVFEYVADSLRMPTVMTDFLYFPDRPETSAQLQSAIEGFALEASGHRPGWDAMCESYLSNILMLLSRQYEKSVNATPESRERHRLLTAVTAYIADHYADVTLEDLAQAFNYSPSHMSNLIRDHNGKRFSAIVHDLRLEHAKSYLERTDSPLNVIAKQTGFSNASHLARSFKAKYGITPGAHRNNSPESA